MRVWSVTTHRCLNNIIPFLAETTLFIMNVKCLPWIRFSWHIKFHAEIDFVSLNSIHLNWHLWNQFIKSLDKTISFAFPEPIYTRFLCKQNPMNKVLSKSCARSLAISNPMQTSIESIDVDYYIIWLKNVKR